LATDTETAAAITAAIAALPPGYGRGNTASRPVSPTVGDIYVNTQTGFVEIYESTGWSAVGVSASAVTGVTATDSPSGRAYNNGRASVAFTPGTVAGRTYTVTSSPGSYTSTGSSSPLIVTGLQSSTQYTYIVAAATNYGAPSSSSASSGVTATTVPQNPSLVATSLSETTASIAITAGATGGSAITGYTITSNPATTNQTTSSSPYIFTGLTNGTSYTFTAIATNANGNSTASSVSNSITAAPPAPKIGYATGGSSSTSINRLDMATDTRSVLSATNSQTAADPAGFANSGATGAGYRAGGGGPISSIDKLSFQNESRSTLGATLTSARRQLGGFANSGTAGYSCGGYDGSYLANVNKLTFSNDSNSSLGASMSVSRYGPGSGMADSGVRGYIGGGEPTGGQQNTTISVVTFSNDTIANLGQNLAGTDSSNGKLSLTSFANSGTAGYLCGGGPGGSNRDIFKINFSTNTGSLLGAQLTNGRGNSCSFANSGTAGYMGGAEANSNDTTILKHSFSTDTTSQISATLSANVNNGTGFANSGTL
jgi:hypothetical protein